MSETVPSPTAVLGDVRTRRADWGHVVLASLYAGAAFLLVDVVARAAADETRAWATPRRIAALLVGERVVGESGEDGGFQLGVFVLALVLHAMLSLVFGMLLVLAIRRMRLAAATVVGIVYGLALYLFNYHLMTGLFPWFADVRGPIAVCAHIAFGVTAVVSYGAMRHRGSRTAHAILA